VALITKSPLAKSTLFLAIILTAGIVAMVAWHSPASQAEDVANLVANGDFAQARDGKPLNWDTEGNPKDVDLRLELAQDGQGRPFARLVCARCEKTSGWSHAMLLQLGRITLVKGRTYEFSCRMRQENILGRTIDVAIQDTKTWSPGGLQAQFAVGAAWQTRRQTFRAERDIGSTGRLQIWFAEPGTLEIADVRLVEVGLGDVEFTDLAPPGQGRNLVFNGSFELGSAGWSSIGNGAGWGNLDCLHGQILTAPAGLTESHEAAPGRSFLRIPMGGGHTPLLCFDYFEAVATRELRPLAATLGWIPVKKGEPYTLSCRLRASVGGTKALLAVCGRDPSTGRGQDYRLDVALATAWQPYKLTFRPRQPYVFVMLGPNLDHDERVDVDLDAVQLEQGDNATGFQPRSPIEFALSPSADGGIFTQGQPASVALCAANASVPARVKVALEAEDYQERPVRWTEKTLDVPAGASVRQEVALPPDWRGFYRIRAKVTDAAGAAIPAGPAGTADLRIAIVPKRSGSDSVCGVNHAFVSPRLIDLAAKAGVSWYRDWSLKWQQIEPVRGQYRWEVGDMQIDRVLQRGMHVLALLPPFPSANWCSEAPTSVPAATGEPGAQAWAPKDPNDLAGFVENAVRRYKDRVQVWEFLNEPIYTGYALPAKNQYGGKKYTPADYVSLLAVASAAMKKADPACRVMGGIAGGPELLTSEVIQAGCLKHVDLFNLHIYPGLRPPESFTQDMDQLLARMDAAGGRKPIWITEFSYYGADDLPRRPFVPTPNSWSEDRLLESERQCADWTVRFLALMLSRGVEKVFIHSGSSGSVNQPDFECCLFGYGGSPRKAFPALAVMTDFLGEKPVPAGARRLGQGGHAVAFEAGGRSVLMAWAEEGAGSDGSGGSGSGAPVLVLPAEGQVRAFDLMGRPLSGASITLSPSPIYLLGPAGKAKPLLEALLPAGSLDPATPPRLTSAAPSLGAP